MKCRFKLEEIKEALSKNKRFAFAVIAVMAVVVIFLVANIFYNKKPNSIPVRNDNIRNIQGIPRRDGSGVNRKNPGTEKPKGDVTMNNSRGVSQNFQNNRK